MATPEVVLRACTRHGAGISTATPLEVRLRVTHLGGAIPRLKGLGRTHPHPGEVTVAPFEGRTVFHDYPAPGRNLVYERGSILADGILRTGFRRRFRGLRKLRRWRPEHAAYFFGYAMALYLGLPYTLVGREPLRIGRRRDRGRALDFLSYEHPDGAETHSRRETYYFAQDGLLLRHDYRADVIGPFAYGAHHSEDYADLGGVAIATRRVVRARLGRFPTPIKVLEARFDILDVRTTDEAA